MKQFVLVAGVDYEFRKGVTGVNFRQFCDNRRKAITAKNTAHEELRFTVIDFRAGEVVTVVVTYPGGRKLETTARAETFDPIKPSHYDPVPFPDGTTHNFFKPGQSGVLSVTDVYRIVRAIGVNDPGTLAELDFFSHGWMGGPILVNSTDDRSTVLPVPSTGGAPATATFDLTGMSMRDPDDKDPRPGLDFIAPTMDAAALLEFQHAFAADGIVWLWGCAFPRTMHHLLTAIERSDAYRSTGLADDVELTLKNLTEPDTRFLERFLLPVLGTPFPAPRSTVKVRFKHVKFWACQANQSAYAAQIATAAKVRTFAAPLGTAADYDTEATGQMHVNPVFGAHLAFYKNYLGMTFDPEGRRYGLFKPNAVCTAPPP